MACAWYTGKSIAAAVCLTGGRGARERNRGGTRAAAVSLAKLPKAFRPAPLAALAAPPSCGRCEKPLKHFAAEILSPRARDLSSSACQLLIGHVPRSLTLRSHSLVIVLLFCTCIFISDFLHTMTTDTADTRSGSAGMAQLAFLSWLEPLVVVGIMVATVIVTRRRNPNPLAHSPTSSPRRSEDGLLQDKDDYTSDSDNSSQLSRARSQSPSLKTWTRRPYPITLFNRILAKFPFLVELFYWILNYTGYRMSKVAAASMHAQKGGKAVVELAQQHGISILNFEHDSPFKAFFSPSEVHVQRFLMDNHPSIMTILNQIYSLVHIPGTVLYVFATRSTHFRHTLTLDTASSPGTTTPRPTTTPSPLPAAP